MRTTFAPGRQIDDAVIGAGEVRERQRRDVRGDALRASAAATRTPSRSTARGGMLRFNLERLNHLEFVDATDAVDRAGAARPAGHRPEAPGLPAISGGPAHIIGYEHTFIATLAEFLECLSRDVRVPSELRRTGSRCSRCSTRMLPSAKTRQWTDVSAS